tara:strand:- start:2114 stop:2356 length:243 start_codon:yes stop_codon:yes gene_type:complete
VGFFENQLTWILISPLAMGFFMNNVHSNQRPNHLNLTWKEMVEEPTEYRITFKLPKSTHEFLKKLILEKTTPMTPRNGRW